MKLLKFFIVKLNLKIHYFGGLNFIGELRPVLIRVKYITYNRNMPLLPNGTYKRMTQKCISAQGTRKNIKDKTVVVKTYSTIKLTPKDLSILHDSASAWLTNFIERNPRYIDLKLLGICLCQGGAMHYVHYGYARGINDFDIWLFFEKQDGVPDFPKRLVANESFPTDKFGQSSNCINFPGRRIDIMGRSIKAKYSVASDSISDWILNTKNHSPQELRKSHVILLSHDNKKHKLIV